ncbi:hypothetical protein J2W76_002069 [Methylorubrum zatmanii]|nr:hypothetical protein [Methylorubrum zatmanii]MCP1554563.1 hypothetical protein [Methylorubrum extorquens]MCP1579127.1 hypothetical protein [Methylorubrum extorquens]
MRRIHSAYPAAAQDRAVAATLCVLVFLECLTLIASVIWL